MRLAPALLVIVDISGYTEFITNRQVSLLHAEQIITDLMESVIDHAGHPLAVNKLEGDAALLFREYEPADADAATRDVLAQAEFPLLVSDKLVRMPERLFREEPIGLDLGSAGR